MVQYHFATTLTGALRQTAGRNPSRPAALDGDRQYTWTEWLQRIAAAATVLTDLGLRPGERVGLLATNSRLQAEFVFAGYWSGIVPVPINFRLAAGEIAFILDDAACQWLIIDPAFVALLKTEPLMAWGTRCLLLGEAGGHDDIPGSEERVCAAKPAAPTTTTAATEAMLLYTGGTTGRAKGVPLTHGNILANAVQISARCEPRSDDIVLHVPPMFHSAELCMNCYWMAGAASAWLAKFEPAMLLEAIQRYRATYVLLVPTMLQLMLNAGLMDEYDVSSLRQLIYGTSPMSPALLQRVVAAFPGVAIAQGYGLTETAPLLAMLDNRSHRDALRSGRHERLASCGTVLPGVELRIIDANGNDVSAGDVGEIIVRGPNVFSGYLNQPQATRAAFTDGWFRTGDLAQMDDERFLYWRDRVDDMIKTGGEKVFSGEVERVINTHPEVEECAVIGVADETYGQQVCALVVLKADSALSAPQLQAHCRAHLGGFKVPRRFTFVGELPKSAMGKVLKRRLRERESERQT